MARRKRVMHRHSVRRHVLLVVLFSAVFLILLSPKIHDWRTPNGSVEDLLLEHPSISGPFLSNGMHLHRMSIMVRNTNETLLDCALNLTVKNESYKNSTILELPRLGAGGSVNYTFSFLMPHGKSDVTLRPVC